MLNKTKISVVIPAFNEARFLPKCVESISKQLGDFNIEITVVDNNSKDGTFEIAKKLGVKVINEKRQGVSWTRKIGTENAKGEFILNIDADTRLPNNYLIEALKRFEKNKNLVCLSGQLYFYDGSWWQNLVRPFFHYGLWIFTFLISKGTVGPMGNNMIFKKDIYGKTSGFDGNLKLGEDVDLSKKMSKFGKVRLDMSLKSYSSARRFVLDKELWYYFLNFMFIYTVGHPYKNKFSESKKY